MVKRIAKLIKLFSWQTISNPGQSAYLSEKGSSSQTSAAVATCRPVIQRYEILAIMAMTVCSLILKGLGLRSISSDPSHRGKRTIYNGSAHARKRPTGYAAILCMAECPTSEFARSNTEVYLLCSQRHDRWARSSKGEERGDASPGHGKQQSDGS